MDCGSGASLFICGHLKIECWGSGSSIFVCRCLKHVGCRSLGASLFVREYEPRDSPSKAQRRQEPRPATRPGSLIDSSRLKLPQKTRSSAKSTRWRARRECWGWEPFHNSLDWTVMSRLQNLASIEFFPSDWPINNETN